MECRARVLYRRGRGCVTGTPAGCVAGVPGAVGPARSPLGFTVPSGPGEPVLVPEGGGPPARSPHASLRLGVVDLEARPGPAAALRHPGMRLGPPAPSTPVARGASRAARPCRRPQTPRLWLRRRCSGCRRARPPARRPRREPMARRVGSKPGQALRSRRYPPHWWRGCVVGGQARTWRIHGLGAELPCTRRRVRKM